MKVRELMLQDYDDYKSEIINGEIVYMSPSPRTAHGKAVGNLYLIIGNYLKGKKCKVYLETDVDLTQKNGKRQVFIPDLFVLCDKSKDNGKTVVGAPDFVVEVLSPSTAKRDKTIKMEIYEKSGVKEYWIVNINDKSIEVYLNHENKLKLDEIYQLLDAIDLMKTRDDDIIIENKLIPVGIFDLDPLIIPLEDIFDDV